jgi:NCAIR mutase (PurE)-related protein
MNLIQFSSKISRQLIKRRYSNLYGVTSATTTTSIPNTNNFSSGSNNDSSEINFLLQNVKSGKLSIEDATQTILEQQQQQQQQRQKVKSKSNLDSLESFANLDHTRATRTGFPEAVFASGKTPQQIATILDDMAANVNNIIEREGTSNEAETSAPQNAILATRVDAELYKEILKIPLKNGTITYHEMANIVSMEASALQNNNEAAEENNLKKKGRIVVACAGTTDLPVAEEAAITLEAAGTNVDRIYDVGVAGLHRIINALPRLRDPDVDCIIVCAGMDGALPSVVAGLVSVPVIAVPTSIGYGASFNGISAMLTMLNSCAPGVGVVNIDNGFGGAALAFKCVKKD